MARSTVPAAPSHGLSQEPTAESGRGRRLARPMAWAGVALALAGGAAELSAAAGYRLQWWSAGAGIAALGIGAIAAAVGAVLALAALIVARRRGAARVAGPAAAALVLGALFAAPPFASWRQATALPAIHDISTDTVNPPRFVAVLPLRADAPNGVDYGEETAALQRTAYPDIGPALLPHAPDRALVLAERAAREMGWTVIDVAPADLRLEATATTRLFGFRDDVVVRITPAAGGSRVDVRSTSRVGRSDIGANAQRIRAYLRTLGALARGAA